MKNQSSCNEQSQNTIIKNSKYQHHQTKGLSQKVHNTLLALRQRKQNLLKGTNFITGYQNEEIKRKLIQGSLHLKEDNTQVFLNDFFCLNIHIDGMIFKDRYLQGQIMQFLQQYRSKTDLLSLSKILSFNICQEQQYDSQYQPNQDIATKILKLNLKYSLNTKQSIKETQKSAQRIINIFLICSSWYQNKLIGQVNRAINLISFSWVKYQNTFIFIVKQNQLIQNRFRNLDSHLYKTISETFVKLQKSTKSSPPVLIINSLNQIFQQKLCQKKQGLSNIYKLCQIQNNLFKAEQILKHEESFKFLKQRLVQSYLEKVFIKKSLTSLRKFMLFYKLRSINMSRKYFMIWSMITAQSMIKKLDLQIVDSKYCQQKYQKSLKKKIFGQFKIFHKMNQNNKS